MDWRGVTGVFVFYSLRCYTQIMKTYLLIEGATILVEKPSFEDCLREGERLLIENPDRLFRIAQSVANMHINAKPAS